MDLVTCIFVMSDIHPTKHQAVFYNLYDMAMIRFRPGSKIGENFYTRQDGTRSYFFQASEVEQLGLTAGLVPFQNQVVERRTVNVKERVDVARNFVQSKFRKPV